MVGVHTYLESRGVCLHVYVARVRFDHEIEAFARLSLQNITKSVTVTRGVNDGSQLCLIESGTKSLQEGTSGIKGTQRHGESIIVENAFKGNRVIRLQSISIVENIEL